MSIPYTILPGHKLKYNSQPPLQCGHVAECWPKEGGPTWRVPLPTVELKEPPECHLSSLPICQLNWEDPQHPVTTPFSAIVLILHALSCNNSVWTKWQSVMLTDLCSPRVPLLSLPTLRVCPSRKFCSLPSAPSQQSHKRPLLVQTQNFYLEVRIILSVNHFATWLKWKIFSASCKLISSTQRWTKRAV